MSHIVTRGLGGKQLVTRGYGFSSYRALMVVIGDIIFRRVELRQVFTKEYIERIIRRDSID